MNRNEFDFQKVEASNFWNDKYIKNEISWDLAGPTPAFVKWFKNKNKNKKIIIPGAGNGYDAIHLAKSNFDVYAVDFASEPIANMKNKNLSNLNLIMNDFFNLSKKYNSQFDYFLEYTFFCAINPRRRFNYIKKSFELLKPNGVFVGMLLPIDNNSKDEGPPFAVNIEETIEMFSEFYTNIKLKKTKLSIEPRKEIELFITMKKHA